MLTGKIALVTGASRGIGKCIAMGLAKEGAFVYVNYMGSKEKAEEAVASIEAAGGAAKVLYGNVANVEESEAMMKQIIDEQGRIDILVNNAGITRDNLVMRMTEDEFEQVMNVNLKGAFHMIHLSSRYFLKQRAGRIINIASVVGVTGNAGQANYAASKAGLIGMSKSVAKELASRGVTVNVVAPGMIDTDMTQVLSEGVKEAMVKQIPLGKAGNPEDIANAVVFLASDKASYITGQVLNVDGGMVM